ncbi:hypothetical protein C7974DRAFT_388964 [Boeremia exigua]|uniref:uncharacterized protein n=1 Tax=Boeremia exigua TaxID=749465 RepID=UPI001E8D4F6B|nr:uncharacterized protein C7974DRAFT_388964 [Boeremia exigua]KAH6639660.1 hypothetical protein C7974DRAFT_388964 [Boeremia exigua]
MTPLHVEKISSDVFRAALARYPGAAPSILADLDALRYQMVPAKLENMKGDPHLLKADVEKLVEWKLKHGTFRPALMNLVKSNPADLIKATTQSAFSSLESGGDVMAALKILTQLRGIGPATASLLLSVYQPDEVPFFSDELFRWTHWGGSGAGEGWERKIKYNVSEYKEILASIRALRERLDVGATQAEKVAYVLGMEKLDMDGGVGGEEKTTEKKTIGAQPRAKVTAKEGKEDDSGIKGGGDHQDGAKDSAKLLSKDENIEKKGTKRKAQEQKVPTEGTRRSTRKKV